MNISSATQFPLPANVQRGKSNPPQSAEKATASIDDASLQPKIVDLRNVSINEINELIRSGVVGLLEA